jgi:succinoglycan biosynthesis transport protein ExoP
VAGTAAAAHAVRAGRPLATDTKGLMSNEIQLSSLGQSLPAMPGAGGAMGGYYGGGPGGPPPGGDENPLRKVHKLLRGRYLLAFVLGFVGAAAGAVAGYLSQKPAFKAEAMIEIKPVVAVRGALPTEQDRVLTMFSSYVTSQVARIQGEKAIRLAMQDPKWRAVRPGAPTEAAINAFSDNLTVALAPRTNTMILVGYSSNSPDAKKEATAAVQSLLAAWQSEYGKDDAIQSTKKVEYWQNECQRIANDIQLKQMFIEEQTKVTDGDPSALRKWEDSLVTHQMELDQLKLNVTIARSTMKEMENGTRRKPTPDDWGRVDPTMASLIKTRNELSLTTRALIAQFGFPTHPAVVSRQKELNAVEEQITQTAAELDSKYLFVWKPDGTGGNLLSKDLSLMEQNIVQRTKQVQEENLRVQAIRQAAAKIDSAKRQIEQLNVTAATANEALKDWMFRKDNLNLTNIVSDGSLAKADKDRRPIFAAVGFMGGAGIPIGLLLLFGLFDTRYRFSDETAASAGGAGVGGLTLLGILPNLPDRLSDPEQAAIAAHCVHQIRTMLQINAGLEDRRVFSVTSASPGDGKTSLTLALGLSYAACGTRTLLIDCDLIGSGLSSRMNVSAPEGVLEAIANRSLMSYVRQTDVNDVSILPVGSAGNLHASTLSPQSLRRLIEEAEQHFEVVLIDTGPVLGSIEASLVCAAADAVILTVSRGQQRPMVERSLGHLAAIGARLAGVVFNRAQAQDFERSISGVSMRSVGVPGLPRGARAAGPRLGPVARAVRGESIGSGEDESQAGQPPVN